MHGIDVAYMKCCVPASVLVCSAMSCLSIQAQNILSGSIPDMSNLTSLVLFDLSDNQLTGSLPLAWAYSVKLSYFSVQTNRLSGSIPVSHLAKRYLGKPNKAQIWQKPQLVNSAVCVIHHAFSS